MQSMAVQHFLRREYRVLHFQYQHPPSTIAGHLLRPLSALLLRCTDEAHSPNTSSPPRCNVGSRCPRRPHCVLQLFQPILPLNGLTPQPKAFVYCLLSHGPQVLPGWWIESEAAGEQYCVEAMERLQDTLEVRTGSLLQDLDASTRYLLVGLWHARVLCSWLQAVALCAWDMLQPCGGCRPMGWWGSLATIRIACSPLHASASAAGGHSEVGGCGWTLCPRTWSNACPDLWCLAHFGQIKRNLVHFGHPFGYCSNVSGWPQSVSPGHSGFPRFFLKWWWTGGGRLLFRGELINGNFPSTGAFRLRIPIRCLPSPSSHGVDSGSICGVSQVLMVVQLLLPPWESNLWSLDTR